LLPHHLGDGELTIHTVRDHSLTRLKPQLLVIEVNCDYIRLERHQVGDTTHLGIGVGIRPPCQMRVTDVVIAA
jgi:hypothetical protein